MLLGRKPGESTVIDGRTPNEISKAKKPSPKQLARSREARRDAERASVRARLLNPPMDHVDTVSVPFYSSSSSEDIKPAG